MDSNPDRAATARKIARRTGARTRTARLWLELRADPELQSAVLHVEQRGFFVKGPMSPAEVEAERAYIPPPRREKTRLGDPIFTAVDFIAPEYTDWQRGRDKAKFANHFIRFVRAGYPRELFYHWFYTRLSMCRGHIAHYDAGGFYATWFADRERRRRFVIHWLTRPIYGDPSCTYSDVEERLRDWFASWSTLNTEEKN
jgi:hypothetical protein